MVCRTAGGGLAPLSPRFDAEAAQLHLVVNAPEELDVAVRQVANQIPVLYRRAPGTSLKGLGMNASGQTWTVEVASSQSSATNVQFAGDTDGNWLHLGVQHIDLCVGGDRWEWL